MIFQHYFKILQSFLSSFLLLNSSTTHKFKYISTIMNQEYHFKYKGVEYDASDWA